MVSVRCVSWCKLSEWVISKMFVAGDALLQKVSIELGKQMNVWLCVSFVSLILNENKSPCLQ